MERIKNRLGLENIHIKLKAQSELGALRVMINQAINTPSVIKPAVFAQAVVDSDPVKMDIGMANTLIKLRNFLCQHEYAEKIRQAKIKNGTLSNF